ncbi:MAG: hypothetical protein R3A45_06595 [Bdellovibrionota bacterium]
MTTTPHFDHLKVLGLIDTGIEINDHNFMQYEDFFRLKQRFMQPKAKDASARPKQKHRTVCQNPNALSYTHVGQSLKTSPSA